MNLSHGNTTEDGNLTQRVIEIVEEENHMSIHYKSQEEKIQDFFVKYLCFIILFSVLMVSSSIQRFYCHILLLLSLHFFQRRFQKEKQNGKDVYVLKLGNIEDGNLIQRVIEIVEEENHMSILFHIF